MAGGLRIPLGHWILPKEFSDALRHQVGEDSLLGDEVTVIVSVFACPAGNDVPVIWVITVVLAVMVVAHCVDVGVGVGCGSLA